MFLAVGAAFLLERMDRRLRDREEVAETFGRPIIGVIPRSRAFSRSGKGSSLPGRDMEAFLLLRANLRYFNVTHKLSSVLVTSAAPGDGKSTISKHLAIATVLAEGRALLIEADMRHPVLRDEFGISPRRGLSNVLAGEVPLALAVESIPLDGHAGQSEAPTLDVLFAGPIPPNPTDLIESDRMRRLIAEAESAYDLVVIDTPPTSIVSDAIPLVGTVDGVIVVSRLGRSTRDASRHLRDQLVNLGAPVLGVVVNDARVAGSYYSYGYDAVPDGAQNGHAPGHKSDPKATIRA
jgi:capsular exopolysaccharide synthesis family protein